MAKLIVPSMPPREPSKYTSPIFEDEFGPYLDEALRAPEFRAAYAAAAEET